MNAAEYLQNQGWRGTGHSLDPHNRGLTKPLLAARKPNSAGLGLKQHDFANQWWLNAWDKPFGSAQKAENQPARHTLHASSQQPTLYSNFVLSEPLEGTFAAIDRSSEGMPRKEKQSSEKHTTEEKASGRAPIPHDSADPKTLDQTEKPSKKRKREAEQDGTVGDVEKKKNRKSEFLRSRDVDSSSLNEIAPKKIKRKKEKAKSDKGGVGEGDENELRSENGEDHEKKKHKRRKEMDRNDGAPSADEQKKDQEHETSTSEGQALTSPKAMAKRSDVDADILLNIDGDTTMAGPSTMEHSQAGGVSEGSVDGKKKSSRSKEKKEHKNKEKNLPGELRADCKRPRAEKAEEGTHRNRAHEVEEKAAAIANGTLVEKERSPPRKPKPLHPDSIAALRARGEEVKLHSPPPPPERMKPWLDPKINLAAPWVTNSGQIRGPQDLARNNPGCENQPQKRLKGKQEKYVREKAKRVAKNEWKHWQEVRAHPEDYRPDGTCVTSEPRGGLISEINQKRLEAKQARQAVHAEKSARHGLKEQMKVERRVARKQRRSEKKRRHVELQQRNISMKKQRQKRERDEQLAAQEGLTYEAFVARREQYSVERRHERDEKRAAELGIPVEQVQKERAELLDSRDLEKEARKLGLTAEEYANQAADPNESELGSGNESEAGLKDGTWDTFGRSAIDKLWARHQKEQKDPQQNPDEVDRRSSGSSSDSDSNNESDNDESDASSNGSDKENDATSNSEAKPDSKPKDSEDFIAFDNDPIASLPFTIDTGGDPSIVPPDRRRVKDMTKEERKARLEAMRARRAKRAEHTGVVKLTKKERRKRRAQRKEQLIGRMTHDILTRKRRADNLATTQDPDPSAGSGNMPDNVAEGADFLSFGGDATKAAKASDKRSAGKGPGKSQIKQARREARRIMRGMKKGKITEHEIPEDWRWGKMNRKPKLSGKGGRGPKKFHQGPMKV